MCLFQQNAAGKNIALKKTHSHGGVLERQPDLFLSIDLLHSRAINTKLIENMSVSVDLRFSSGLCYSSIFMLTTDNSLGNKIAFMMVFKFLTLRIYWRNCVFSALSATTVTKVNLIDMLDKTLK